MYKEYEPDIAKICGQKVGGRNDVDFTCALLLPNFGLRPLIFQQNINTMRPSFASDLARGFAEVSRTQIRSTQRRNVPRLTTTTHAQRAFTTVPRQQAYNNTRPQYAQQPTQQTQSTTRAAPPPPPSSAPSATPSRPENPLQSAPESSLRSLTDGLSDPPPTLSEDEKQVDWTRSFHGLSSAPFSSEQAAILTQELEFDDIEIKPDGILYLPEIKYRRILNKAFGPGGWGLAPRGETIVTGKVVTREYGLVAGGRYVQHPITGKQERKNC